MIMKEPLPWWFTWAVRAIESAGNALDLMRRLPAAVVCELFEHDVESFVIRRDQLPLEIRWCRRCKSELH